MALILRSPEDCAKEAGIDALDPEQRPENP